MEPSQKFRPRFASVAVRNWRNFKNADVDLEQRVFIVGPNASGKSNFLDVFKFLRDVASEGGGLAEAARRRGGVSSLRCLSAIYYSNIDIRVCVIGESSQNTWEYELVFNEDKKKRTRIVKETIVSNGRKLLVRPEDDDKKDPEQLTQTHLEQIRLNKNFRELAEFFRSTEYLHVVPQMLREPARYVGQNRDPFGWDLLERIWRTPKKTRNLWLKKIEKALRMAVPQLSGLKVETDDRGIPHLKAKYEHWRPQDAWQSEGVFSDGTLRLIGLLWSVLEGNGALLLEEPEQSLHPAVVRRIAAMVARVQSLSGRQVVMSTHSADLLAEEGIDLQEVLLLVPTKEGTEIRRATSIREARILLSHRHIIGEIVLPATEPRKISQLDLFAAN